MLAYKHACQTNKTIVFADDTTTATIPHKNTNGKTAAATAVATAARMLTTATANG